MYIYIHTYRALGCNSVCPNCSNKYCNDRPPRPWPLSKRLLSCMQASDVQERLKCDSTLSQNMVSLRTSCRSYQREYRASNLFSSKIKIWILRSSFLHIFIPKMFIQAKLLNWISIRGVAQSCGVRVGREGKAANARRVRHYMWGQYEK